LTRSLQLDSPSLAPTSRTVAFNPQCSPAVTIFSREYYQVGLIAIHLPIPEGSKTELAWAKRV